jgi:hypothetical protein
VRVLSAYDLDRLVTSDGATWLDRQLVNRDRGVLADAGFGAEVRGALERRKDELIRQGHAWHTPEGGVRARRDLLPTLENLCRPRDTKNEPQQNRRRVGGSPDFCKSLQNNASIFS